LSGIAGAAEIDYQRDIRPILSDHCFACHGVDAKKREAELRLDTADGATAELDSGDGHAIVPGKSAQSILVRRITSTDKDERMPPAKSGKHLNAKQIELLTQWINQGGRYANHWAFETPKRPQPPTVKQTDWPRGAIDRFILHRLEQEKLAPAAEADRRTLIRRIALDLTGLPPTLAEVKAFVDDKTPDAYEKMIDRYLASPRYGEHLARYWLDAARYADTNGYQYDTERTMWVWRDWVIDAYNRNMPFDQFTIHQLAGDLLPSATPQQRLATGFNRNHGITIEGGVIDEEYRTEYVIDRIVTTSTVWLGLTMGCARCHDHKFDPIAQKEFYQFFAFFNQVPERGNSGFTPNAKIASPLAASQSRRLLDQIAALEKQLVVKRSDAQIDRAMAAWEKQHAANKAGGWSVVVPSAFRSTGGSTLKLLDDHSLLAGGKNPSFDIYEITASTKQTGLTAVRLEALTHASLPGGGPGRHENSNFVLTEFELTAVSIKNPSQSKKIKFRATKADYEQPLYPIARAIDGASKGAGGWAVDGPTRKKDATAMFVAAEPFGFEGGTTLKFRLRHESVWPTSNIGRVRLAATSDALPALGAVGLPASIRAIFKVAGAKRTPQQQKTLRDYFVVNHPPAAESWARERIAQLQATKKKLAGGFPPTMVMQDMPKPRVTHVLLRGEYDKKGEVVTAGVPAFLPPLPKGAPANRLGLARWLVDPAHPLTARVAVNRHWQRIFGTGIVKTSEDFGNQSAWPSHPELLDWLATEFVRSGWDVKALQKLILMSTTYRQQAKVSAELLERDPENRLLAHGPNLRLEAEELRDSLLAISGLLVQRLGGPSVYPYQPEGLWMELNNRPGYSKKYPRGKGEQLYRRSMYTFWKRTVPSPQLQTFDAPEREFCTMRRSRTNTPLQAMLLLNGPQFIEAARCLGHRMMTQGGASVEQRVGYGMELATARRPTAEERAILVRYFQSELTKFQKAPDAAKKLLSVGDSPYDTALDVPRQAAWASVGRLILNLHETITKS
jgi:hypothetical protein